LHGGEGLGKRGEKQGEMDTVRPVTGWWMYNVEKGEEGVVDGRRREIGAEELWKIQSVESDCLELLTEPGSSSKLRRVEYSSQHDVTQPQTSYMPVTR